MMPTNPCDSFDMIEDRLKSLNVKIECVAIALEELLIALKKANDEKES